jgi:hypothetical protein
MDASTLREDPFACSECRGPVRADQAAAGRVDKPPRAARFLAVTGAAVLVMTGLASRGRGEAFETGGPVFGEGAVVSDGQLPAEGEFAFEPDEGFTAPSPGVCETCGPTPCGRGCDRCCPKWTIQVDALMLWQGGIPSRPLYLDAATGATVIDANDLQTPVTIDPRYAILYHADDCRSFEVNYFNLSGFEGEIAAPIVGGPFEMNDLAGLNYAGLDTASARSQAAIKSLEFNLRRRGWGEIDWLTGFRWLEWNQGLLMVDTSSIPVPNMDVIDVETVNNLYGWQWGGDLMLWNSGERLRVNGIAKAGVYYNHQAGQVTRYLRDGAAPTIVGDADDTVAFVGEAGVMGSYAITNWLSLRVGYTFFWLGGVATPADQLAETTVDPTLTPDAKVSPFGSVFLQGVQTGVEARW